MTKYGPLRILHLIDTGGPGGAETVFLTLAARDEALGRNAATVVPYDGWLAERLRDSGVRPVVLASRGSFNLRLLGTLIGLLRTRSATLLHSHLLGSNVYAALAGLWCRTPVVAVFHGATDLADSGRLLWLKRWLILRPHVCIVAVSEAVRTALVTCGIPETRVTLIRNGVDTASFSPGHSDLVSQKLGLHTSARIIGAVGNIRTPKAYEILIREAQFVVERRRDTHVAIFGAGSDADRAALLALVASLGISKHVHLKGFLPASAELYRSFDVFVSSARSEGLPLSFLEAMACGIPIAATDNEGSGPLLREAGAGLLSPVGDPKALAENLIRLLEDRELASRFGAAGRRSACERFGLDATLTRYDALYAVLRRRDHHR